MTWYGRRLFLRDYRDSVGWDNDPLPGLEEHMTTMGINVGDIDLSPEGLHGLSLAGPGYQPTVRSNTRSKRAGPDWSRQMLLAHELCHLLFDWRSGEDFSLLSSDCTDWPTEARANAFAAELVMPREGVAEVLKGRPVDFDLLGEVMSHFGVGIRAASWHLVNLDLLDEDERLALLREHDRRQTSS